jgi:phenylacetate-CoA ligase
MTLHVETLTGAAIQPEVLAATLAAVTKLRGGVELHAVGTLPEDRKLIVDER